MTVFIFLRNREVSRLADARILILQDPSIAAAIRAERLSPKSDDIDDALRMRLRFTPIPVNAYNVNGPANLISFSPDGSHVAVASGSIVSCFSLDSPNPVFTMTHTGPVHSLEFSPDGIWLASGSADKTRWLHNLRNGSEHSIPFGSPVTAIAFSPLGAPKTFIATGTASGKVYLSTIPDTKTLSLTHRDSVSALAFSPNGSALATASADRTAQLWTTDTGRNFAILEHPGAVKNVLYSPDGKYVATGAADAKARIWLAQKDAPALYESESQIKLFKLAFRPDGGSLAAIGSASLRLIEVPTGKVVDKQQTNAEPLDFVFTPPTGAMLALRNGAIISPGQPGLQQIWSIAQKPGLVSIAFSNDGKYVGSASKAGAFIVWKLDPGDGKKYDSLTGTALADAACQKLKPILSTDSDLSQACHD